MKALDQQYVEFMEKKTNPPLASMCRIVIHPIRVDRECVQELSTGRTRNPTLDSMLSIIMTVSSVCPSLAPTSLRSPLLSADDFKADEEDSRRHIIRHLAALTIPFRASVNIVHSCFQVPREISSMKAYQVIVRPDSQPSITPQYFDLFKAEFAKRCGGEPERVTKALDGIKGAVLSLEADIHAEATLMSLASGDMEKLMVHVDGTLTPIASLLPVSALPLVYY